MLRPRYSCPVIRCAVGDLTYGIETRRQIIERVLDLQQGGDDVTGIVAASFPYEGAITRNQLVTLPVRNGNDIVWVLFW